MSNPSTTAPVRSIAFSPDGKSVVTGADDGEIRLWDVASGLQVGETLKGHSSTVLSVAISKDGTRIASGGVDGKVMLWDATTLGVLHSLNAHDHHVRSVDFSPNGQLLASGSFDDTARIWSVEHGACVIGPIHCDGRVYCTEFSPDGSQLATRTRSIQIWNPTTGSLEITIERGATSLAWTRDGMQIIASSFGKITVYDAATGSRVRGWPAQTSSRLLDSLSLSPCGNLLAGSSEFDDTAYVWNIRSGRQISAYKHRKTVNCVAYSPTGTFIATACDMHNAYLWAAPQNIDFDVESDPDITPVNCHLAPGSPRVDDTYSTCSEVLTKTDPIEVNTSDAPFDSPPGEVTSPGGTGTSVSDPGYAPQPPGVDACVVSEGKEASDLAVRRRTAQDIFRAFFKQTSRPLGAKNKEDTDRRGRQKLTRRRRHGEKLTETTAVDQKLVESAQTLTPGERQNIHIPKSKDKRQQPKGIHDAQPPQVEKVAESHKGQCGLRCF
ncbi:WD40-repeat-containing domain protein [Phlebopus sp. FC_14]|nr:WD40-repeat-containing domain protein [Phlebopus sp. FC_14]